MKGQNRLPKWIGTLIPAVFAAHYLIIIVYIFSEFMLPARFRFWTSHYVGPWFYQNMIAFAPEPDYLRRVMHYRLYQNGSWTEWRDPSLPLLEKQWAMPLHPAYKVLDQVEMEAKNLCAYYERGYQIPDNAEELPAVDAARRIILADHAGRVVADSFQLRVLKERITVHHDTIDRRDSNIDFPVMPWINVE